MRFKTFLNGIVLFIGLGLAVYSQLGKNTQRSSNESTTVEPRQKLERWQLKPGSIYDGDTLRVVRDNEELKIRLCGIDSPELKQKLGVESRDYLRSLIAKGDGTVYLVRAGKDRYGRTVGELFMPLKSNPEQEIHINTEMISAGYAWHYEQYSVKV